MLNLYIPSFLAQQKASMYLIIKKVEENFDLVCWCIHDVYMYRLLGGFIEEHILV